VNPLLVAAILLTTLLVVAVVGAAVEVVVVAVGLELFDPLAPMSLRRLVTPFGMATICLTTASETLARKSTLCFFGVLEAGVATPIFGWAALTALAAFLAA